MLREHGALKRFAVEKVSACFCLNDIHYSTVYSYYCCAQDLASLRLAQQCPQPQNYNGVHVEVKLLHSN